jgi:hypothetical protein
LSVEARRAAQLSDNAQTRKREKQISVLHFVVGCDAVV